MLRFTPYASRLLILFALAAAWLACLLPLPPRPAWWLVALSGTPLLVAGSWLVRRDPREPWLAFVRRTADLHALAAILLAALGVQFEDAHGVTTDGVIYFSQLRSVLFDGDLNVAREFTYLGQPPRPYHVVPIGPTLVWLPLYLAVAGLDAMGRLAGLWPAPADPAANGLTLPYVRAALVSSFAIGAAGLFAVHRHLRGGFERGVALATTVLLFAATPLVWYMVYEPSMTHAASFGFVALFATAAVRWTSHRMTARQSVALGVLIGLAFVSRPQEALFALLPAVLLLTDGDGWRSRMVAAARLAALAFAGAAPFLVLQAVHSAILFSRENFALVGAGGYLDLWHSRWADTLWSSWHGFFSWTPIAYLALVGTVAYVARAWRWTLATVLIVFLMAWINGSTADWNAGWSFGGRRFVSCLVILAPGLAFLIHQLVARPAVAVALIATAAIGWNQLLVAQYADGLLPGSGAPPSFAQIVRQQAAVLTRAPFFYPFAFPANVWFAWRHGLQVDRYDLLAPEPLHQSIKVEFDGSADRFLMDGWGPRGRDQGGELRWIQEGAAELVVPLDVDDRARYPTHVGIAARTRLQEPPVTAVVAVSINGHRIGTLAPAPGARSETTLQTSAEAFRRGFNRVKFERIGVAPDAGPGAPPPVAIYQLWIQIGGRDPEGPQ